MAYCVNCGQQIESTAFCPNCGAQQNAQPQPQVPAAAPASAPAPAPAPAPAQPFQSQGSVPTPAPAPAQPFQQPAGQPFQQQPMNAPYAYPNPTGAYPPAAYNPADSGSFGWAVLGFCFPIVGLILYLVWKNTKPRSAGRAAKGALVGFILGIVANVFSTCAYMLM